MKTAIIEKLTEKPAVESTASNLNKLADSYLHNAHSALAILRNFSQEMVDHIAHEYALVVYNQAERWAKDAVEESRLGNIPDKITKKRSKSEGIWNELKDIKTVGIIEHDPERRLLKIAEPVGVVAGVCPCTNPVVTAMSYAMLAIKSRNALIISAHPRSAKVTAAVVEAMLAAGKEYDLPQNAIQVITKSYPELDTLALSRAIMCKANMIIATGGANIVKVAYESGTPAYGVGAGNAPVIVHPSANITDAAKKIVNGRKFDNGIICASEQNLIVHRDIAARMREELEANGCYFVEDEVELAQLKEILIDEKGHFNKDYIGQSAKHIAQHAGIAVADDMKVLVVYANSEQIGKDPYSGEKMFPMLTFFAYQDFADAVLWSNELLGYEGKGHTAGLHIANNSLQNEKALHYWAHTVSATHLIVNQSTATSAGGSKFNWLTASTTLGCGTYGGTMPMEGINLSVKNLLNYKAVTLPLDAPRPGYRLI